MMLLAYHTGPLSQAIVDLKARKQVSNLTGGGEVPVQTDRHRGADQTRGNHIGKQQKRDGRQSLACGIEPSSTRG